MLTGNESGGRGLAARFRFRENAGVARLDRRTFLRRSALYGGALAAAGPLQALTANAAAGRPVRTTGYGGLEHRGELRLPRGFRARVISRAGEAMSDGNVPHFPGALPRGRGLLQRRRALRDPRIVE